MGMGLSQLHRFCCRRTCYHEAGTGEYTFAMGLDDRLINSLGKPEIVGVNYGVSGHDLHLSLDLGF
jgi:hypothetical protein